ncbi:MAG: T9SS type A sorting domain-containing protein, partial [Bacteroidota bacterium]
TDHALSRLELGIRNVSRKENAFTSLEEKSISQLQGELNEDESPSTIFTLNVSEEALVSGEYELRLTNHGDNGSFKHVDFRTLIIDRIAPRVEVGGFKPINGLVNLFDEIQANFTEPIDNTSFDPVTWFTLERLNHPNTPEDFKSNVESYASGSTLGIYLKESASNYDGDTLRLTLNKEEVKDQAGNKLVGAHVYEFVLNLSEEVSTTPELASIRLEEPINWIFNRDANIDLELPLTIRYAEFDLFGKEVDTLVLEIRKEVVSNPLDTTWIELRTLTKSELETTLTRFSQTDGAVVLNAAAFENIPNGNYLMRARLVSNLLKETTFSNVLEGRVDTTKPYVVTLSPSSEEEFLRYGEEVSFTYSETISSLTLDPTNLAGSDVREIFEVSYLFVDESGASQEIDITQIWLNETSNEIQSLIQIDGGTVTFPSMPMSFFQEYLEGKVKFTLKGMRDEAENRQSNTESVIYELDESSLISAIVRQVGFDCQLGTGSLEVIESDELFTYRIVSAGEIAGIKQGTGSSILFEDLPAGLYTLEMTDNSGNWVRITQVEVEALDEVADPSELRIITSVPVDQIKAGEPVRFGSDIAANQFEWIFKWEDGEMTSNMARPVIIFPVGGIEIDVSLIATFESGCSISYTKENWANVEASGDEAVSSVEETPSSQASVNNTALELYPNPANDVLNISFYSISVKDPLADNRIIVDIYTMKGEKVMHQRVPNPEEGEASISLDVSSLIPNIYIIKIRGVQFGDSVYSFPFVKE